MKQCRNKRTRALRYIRYRSKISARYRSHYYRRPLETGYPPSTQANCHTNAEDFNGLQLSELLHLTSLGLAQKSQADCPLRARLRLFALWFTLSFSHFLLPFFRFFFFNLFTFAIRIRFYFPTGAPYRSASILEFISFRSRPFIFASFSISMRQASLYFFFTRFHRCPDSSRTFVSIRSPSMDG